MTLDYHLSSDSNAGVGGVPCASLAGTREYVNSCGACNTLGANCTAGKKGERASRSERRRWGRGEVEHGEGKPAPGIKDGEMMETR